jgi:hypothetical protein
MAKLNKQFIATLGKNTAKGRSTYVVMPGSAGFFATRRFVTIRGRVDGHPFRSSFSALGDGTHKLPINADLDWQRSPPAGHGPAQRASRGGAKPAPRAALRQAFHPCTTSIGDHRPQVVPNDIR